MPGRTTQATGNYKHANKFTLFGNGVAKAGLAAVEIKKLDGTLAHAANTVRAVSRGFQWAVLVMAVLDFFYIPALIASAWYRGQSTKLPMTKGLRWLAASAVLGLLITSFVLPPLAPFIAFALAVTNLTAGIVALGWHVVRWHELHQKLADVTASLESNPDDKGLLQQQAEIKAKLQKRHLGALMDKVVPVVISLLVLIGVFVCLSTPPIGFSLLLASAVIGASYGFVRLGQVFLSRDGQRVEETPESTGDMLGTLESKGDRKEASLSPPSSAHSAPGGADDFARLPAFGDGADTPPCPVNTRPY